MISLLYQHLYSDLPNGVINNHVGILVELRQQGRSAVNEYLRYNNQVVQATLVKHKHRYSG